MSTITAETYHKRRPGRVKPQPFVTISREAGAGGHSIEDRLVARLREIDQHDPPWTGFDKELGEMLAGESELYRTLVDTLGEDTRSWFREVFANLTSSSATDSEFAIYRKVAEAMRALAEHGRVVLIGRGGVFITRSMPGGVHVLLVAPEEDRIEHLARRRGISEAAAAEEVRRVDASRAAFYKKYWWDRPVGPASFTVTFNTAVSTDQQIVDAILPLIPGIEGRPIPEKPVGVGR
ncbi:MAG: cytidylate kinase-like family protein [Phycisphaeraceae bacterium]